MNYYDSRTPAERKADSNIKVVTTSSHPTTKLWRTSTGKPLPPIPVKPGAIIVCPKCKNVFGTMTKRTKYIPVPESCKPHVFKNYHKNPRKRNEYFADSILFDVYSSPLTRKEKAIAAAEEII